MAKYLDYTGLGTLWGNIKNYFPGIKTKSGDTVSLNTGVAAGNIATFAIDTNNYVTLQGIATSTFAAASHAHGSITSGGAITGSGTALASGDYLVFADSSDSSKLKKSTITIGSATTTFLRNDGTWAIPANTAQLKVSDTSNRKISTTESSDKYIQFTGGTNKITVTDGTNSFDVAITPSISNNVTGSGLTANTIILGNGSSSIKTSSKTIENSLTNDENKIPTSSAVYSAISGLSGAMHFIGTTTTELTDGATTATLAGSGLSKTTGFVSGDVVIYDNKEFVWTGSAWEILGDEGSYALKTVSITGAGVLGGGGDLTANRTITHNTSGVTAQAYGPTADVSGANSINIPKITVDQYGHITAATTYTYTGTTGAKDGRMTISANGGTAVNTLYTANASSATNAINFVQGTGITTAVAAYSGTTPATVTITHADPGTGSEMTTTNGTAAAASAGTTYAVVTGVTVSKDSKGHITGVSTTRQNVVSNQTVNNATLSLQGSASGASATSTGFSANGSTNTTLKFAVSGSAVTSVSTTAASNGVATITINSASSLKNPNSIKIGTKPSSSGTATDIITYDGSAAKALYFSTADASNTNVKFAIDSNGFVTGTVTEANTAQLKVSDTSNKRISTIESSAKYIQFTGGTSKFTVSDGTNSFDVAVGNDMTAITESEINTTCVL